MNTEIGKKILAVMESVQNIEKDGRNAHFDYKYVSDEAIVTKLRVELIKQKLIVVPNGKSCTVTIGKDKSGGDQFLTQLEVQYQLLDTDSGESLTATAYGQGQDKGDKGVYKAATGAEKYFLLKTFLIPTGDDPEKEPYANTRPAQSTGPIAKPSLDEIIENDAIEPVAPFHRVPRPNKEGTISEAQGRRFYAIYKKAGKSDSEVKDYLTTTFGISESRDMRWQDYQAACDWAEGK